MSKSVMDANLYCLNCDHDTEHEIEYMNGKICRIACKECGSTVHLDSQAMGTYYKEDVLNRLLTKPGRMTREMQADLNGFLKSLPHRVITKPYRVYKEFENKNA